MTTSGRQQAIEGKEARTAVRADGFRQAFCAEVIEDMGAGFSLGAFAGSIGASRATLEGWMRAHAGFADAVARARAARLRYWEEAARRLVTAGAPASAATIIMFKLRSIAPEEYGDGARQEEPAAGEPVAPVDDRTLARATALILQRGFDAMKPG
jgi:hypothetical protein